MLFSHLGIPTYFVASLLAMSDWGSTAAESLKKGIMSIFLGDGKITVTNYETKLVSLPTDGASVNTGLTTRFVLGREWLVLKFIVSIIEFAELAIKDALKETKFKDINNFYQSNFNLDLIYWSQTKSF